MSEPLRTVMSDPADLPVIPRAARQNLPAGPSCGVRAVAGGRRTATGEPGRAKEVWMISRYEDIKAALVDPRLSANTMMYVLDTAPNEDVPIIFPRLDDPEHNRFTAHDDQRFHLPGGQRPCGRRFRRSSTASSTR